MAVTKEDVRQLARLVTIDKIVTHPNADKLDIAIIGGWQCVVKRDEFKEGDKGIYFEIDSLLPIEHKLFSFLQERTNDLKKDEDGKVYCRIRTIKLRKELSQGLLLSIPEEFKEEANSSNLNEAFGVMKYVANESDVIEKRERPKKWIDKLCEFIEGEPEPTVYLGWPSVIPKSDQERIQNLPVVHRQAVENKELFEVTYKLHGASVTFYLDEISKDHQRIQMCSRNNLLLLDDIKYSWLQSMRYFTSSWIKKTYRFFTTGYFSFPRWKSGLNVRDDQFVKFYYESNIKEKLLNYYLKTDTAYAVQGELCGPGINSNWEGVDKHRFFVYTVYKLNRDGTASLLMPQEAYEIVKDMGLEYIPVYDPKRYCPDTIAEILKEADGKAFFNKERQREGFVYKSLIRDFSFKVISNKYLLKNEASE